MTAPHRSFRARLTVRIATALGLIVVLGSAAGYWALRTTLRDRLDTILMRLATIEAAATADSPDESVHFHDDAFLTVGAGHDSVLVRYAEVWTRDGVPVLSTRNLGERHLPLPTEMRRRVSSRERPELFDVVLDGKPLRSVLYPLGLAGPQHQVHLLQVAASTDDTEALLARVAAFLAALVVIGFGAGGGVAWWLSGYAVRPVLAIIGEAEVMDASRAGHRITVEAEAAELDRLVAVLNGLLERIDTLLAAQRQFLADAGHAIRTPLTVLRGDVDVALRRERTPDEYRHVLEQSLADLRDVSILAEDLITLARTDGSPVATLERVAVAPVLQAVHERFARAAERAGTHLTIDGEAGVAVRADPVLLERALGNLADNAIKYAGQGAQVTLAVCEDNGGGVVLEVRDTGRGIPVAEQPMIFQRFHRGEAGRALTPGSGLGLAIARAIVEGMGGEIAIESEPGLGTRVVIRLASAT